jgi:hypothetical protein
MPKKIQNTTKAHLVSVPLPNHGTTYTVISHQFVIDYAYTALANAGFGIVDEEYRCTADGQIAQGIYKLNFNNDPELSMMFAWTNSYNKQVKFKCVVGAYINQTGSVMISGEVGSWVRKHTGSADTETKDTIDDYITNAHMYYTQLCSDKATMETVTLNKRKQAQLLGVLFAEYEILTTEQASMIRDQMKRPQQVFANTDSLWAFYNYVTNALQSSHPKTWMEDQRILHYFISTIGNFQQCSTPAQVVQPINSVSEVIETEVDPNQINLLDAIAEAEAEQEVVQEEVENEEVLHQYEEVVEDVIEDTEVPFDIDADDDAVLGSILVPIEDAGPKGFIIEDREISPEKTEDIFPQDETVVYTDPVGNVFEAPVVAPCAAHDTETEKEIEKENLTDIFPQVKVENVQLNETTIAAVIVTEDVEDLDEDIFAEADNFDLDFTENTEDNQDSIPDFF